MTNTWLVKNSQLREKKKKKKKKSLNARVSE